MTRNVLRVLVFAGLPGVLFAQGPTKSPNVYIQHDLVSDIPGMADVTDPNLINPWGMSFSGGSPFWVSNHDKGNATLYNGSGTPNALVVTIPAGAASGASALGTPTGQVQNPTTGFVLPDKAPASFIFDTEDGTISAWNGGAGTTAVVMVDNSAAGAVYKGLAINSSGQLLYAANFNSGTIDVFDTNFKPTKAPGGFTDPTVPSGFAPFNIWNVNGNLYVMYAKQDSAKKFDVAGPGNGYVSVFDFNGNLMQSLIAGSALNSPWGVAIAPANWGAFGSMLLVGNFGNGAINVFNPGTGDLVGSLKDASGQNIVNIGLWALLFGNGGNGGDRNTLYFSAGIVGADGKIHGLLGSIAPPAAITSIVNSASGVAGAIAPGEIVTIYGGTIGPSPLAAGKVPAPGASGSLATTLSTTTVTFNGTPAPVLYASASATSVIVPYELAGSSTANVVAMFRNQTTAAFQTPVAATAPGLFTSNSSGSGQLIAFNQDGTVNGASNPATAGSVVVLFATGEGLTNPPGQDGVVTGEILHEPMTQISAKIGGQTAQVVYAGSAIGLVAGVLQVEVIVPSAAGTGAVPVVITAGSPSSQSGVTIALK